MNQFVLNLVLIFLNFHDVFVHAANEKCARNFARKHLDKMESHKDVTTAECDDFYTYACGNWDTTHQLRKFGARDTLTGIKAANKLLLIRYFDSGDDEASLESNPERKCLWDFYNSCVSLQSEDKTVTSTQIYADVLRRYSNWPILDAQFSEAKANDSFNWEYVSANLRRYGVNTFWRTLVQPNWQNSEQIIFYIVTPSFDFLRRSRRTFKREVRTEAERFKKHNNDDNDDELFLYKTYVKQLLLGMGVRVRKALLYADEIVGFEQDLMSLMTAEENSVVLEAPQTLASLASEFPDIDFGKFFAALLEDLKLPINYDRKLLIVADRSYLRKLSNLLKRTGSEKIGMFLLIQFLVHFEVNLHDNEPYSARQEHCLQQANTFLPKELSRLFLDLKHDERGLEFFESAQRDLTEVFDNLKLVFESLITGTHVFDHSTDNRGDGSEKLYAMKLRFPGLTTDNEGCNSSQRSFLMSGNYDLNLVNLSKLRAQQELLAIEMSLKSETESNSTTAATTTAPSDSLTSYGPLDVNAYYRLKRNAIEIPVGLLSLPIYDSCLEAPFLYATIGFIVGHELLHGFDYDGLNYDQIGNIATDGWMDPKSIIAFGTKASCYLGTRYDNAHTNVNENIADTEGLRLALGAFRRLSGGIPPQSNKLKLFFTSFAQVWCRTTYELTSERHSLHGAHRERVNNVLGNFRAFADTFHCKQGSAMNPAEKCRIW